jgi:amidase
MQQQDNFGTVPYIRGQNLARVLRQAYDDALKTVDVLIMPTMKFKAPKLPTSSRVQVSGEWSTLNKYKV